MTKYNSKLKKALEDLGLDKDTIKKQWKAPENPEKTKGILKSIPSAGLCKKRAYLLAKLDTGD